ncbi:MAG: hypothetical protein KDA30_11930 [Phycisphaerales bacterium]|nr:hypothetical protein [Phycisphaerales bacterium]
MREGRRGRVIVRVLVFGVVGVVLSFASALPVLWVGSIRGSTQKPTVYGSRYWVRVFAVEDEIVGFEPITGVILSTPGPWWSRTKEIETFPILMSIEVASGGPLPTISAGSIGYFDRPGSVPRIAWGVPIGGQLHTMSTGVHSEMQWPRKLPTRVLWRGLIGNTVFYGVIAWLFIVVLACCRRAIRRRRGLCEWCGYSLAGLDAVARCPECGGERRGVKVAPSASV